jgi:SAM-dependent methyltransferase
MLISRISELTTNKTNDFLKQQLPYIDKLKSKAVLYKDNGLLLDIGPDKFHSSFKHFTIETLDIIDDSKDITYIGDITKYVPIERDRFDVVFCCDVFEHTTNGPSMFIELDRILKPNGILLFSVPYMFRLHGPAQDMMRISPQWFKQTFVDVYKYEILEFSFSEVDGTNLEPTHWGMILRKPPGSIPEFSWALYKGTSATANQYLIESYQKQQFSNFGPLVLQLESRAMNYIGARNAHVISCCNATVGLDMLVKAYNKSRIAVQSFTFVSDYMNSLSNTYIVPLRQDGKCGPDINLIPKDTELLVVTNCFNYMHKSTIQEYVKFCKSHNIILIFDFATQTDLKDMDEIGDGAIVSLHDTKPLGRGEGGLIIVPSNISERVRSLIALGKNMSEHSDIQLGTNGKMSEIQAAYILDWWDVWFKYVHVDFVKRFNELQSIMIKNNIKFMFPSEHHEHQLPNVIAVQCTLKEHSSRIPVRKYYKPLCDNDEYAVNLYKNCVCIPILPHIPLIEYNSLFSKVLK